MPKAPRRVKTPQKLRDKLLRWTELIAHLKDAEKLLNAAFDDGVLDADEIDTESLYNSFDDVFDSVRAAVPTE
jgi:hypothetical protein